MDSPLHVVEVGGEEGKDYIGGLEALSLNHLPPGPHTQMRKTQTHFSLSASIGLLGVCGMMAVSALERAGVWSD